MLFLLGVLIVVVVLCALVHNGASAPPLGEPSGLYAVQVLDDSGPTKRWFNIYTGTHSAVSSELNSLYQQGHTRHTARAVQLIP